MESECKVKNDVARCQLTLQNYSRTDKIVHIRWEEDTLRPSIIYFVPEIPAKGKITVNIQQQIQQQKITEGTFTAPKIHHQQFD
jgi:hypothetical protein